MTTAVVRRVGNSLGFTIPSDEAKRLGLHPGDRVIVQIAKAVSMADVAGILKGKLGDIGTLLKEMDEEERAIEARKEAQYAKDLRAAARRRRGAN